jgi:RHS repeat-associated protein
LRDSADYFSFDLSNKKQDELTAQDRAARVTKLRLCPRRVLLYADETRTLVPLALDHTRRGEDGEAEVVHGAAIEWETDNGAVAEVTSYGEVTAISPGKTRVTARAGSARASVLIEVKEGARPVESDFEYDQKHMNDCEDPEAEDVKDSKQGAVSNDGLIVAGEEKSKSTVVAPFKSTARPAAMKAQDKSARLSRTVANFKKKFVVPPSGGSFRGRDFRLKPALRTHSSPAAMFQGPGPIDGDGSDTFAAQATTFNNAVGSPRFGAQETIAGSAAKTKKNLGSYNYQFVAPVLGLGGRGLGTTLALVYNSRLWNKDASQMTFNYDKGWPAAGWRIGFGRIVKNYDNTSTGDGSGVGSANAPGNRLLIQPDGTRIHLQQTYVSAEGVYKWQSNDGTFIHLSRTGKLKYPDGTWVNYEDVNNRFLPTSIRTRNGDLITIAYKPYSSSTFKYRWAIDYIYDTLGRYVRFKYYGEAGYPADAANGKPQNALAAVTAPDFAGGSSVREMVRIEYQDITLKYNFSASLAVTAPANNSILTVVRRIYYPQTGRGYLMADYSTYGCARRISSRKDMTGAGSTITDGTEIAYTKYDYTTIDPADPYNRNQVGSLNDSPQYTKQMEWWQGKTDAAGNADNTESVYAFSRSTATDANGFTIDIATTTYPNGLAVVTTTGNDPTNDPISTGKVVTVEQKDGSTVLFKSTTTYLTPADGGAQIASIETQDGTSPRVRTEFTYGSYGRVNNVYEFGFAAAYQRRTKYTYKDGTAYLDDARLLQLVDSIEVFDSTGTKRAKTVFIYDDYAAKGGMETYGLTSGTYPPNHDSSFDATKTVRGNVTGVQTFSNVAAGTSSTKYTKYDLFGNAVEVDVSCCAVKAFTFSGSNYYSQPTSVRDGSTSGPNLTTQYQYNFNTGLATQASDPDGLNTTFQYDNAWRLLTVTAPTGATTTTQFDKDSNLNDQLAYKEQVTYTDGVTKTITTRSWFDGAGRVLRSGTGAGSSPASYDAVAVIYDSMGRVSKQSNPYTGNSTGTGTGLCAAGSPNQMCWTTNTYDKRSRVTVVTLPDGQTVQTSYSTTAATVTVTDQVGRQRKSEVDGLGRLIKVTEQDTVTGGLTWDTSYSYDVLDNLVGVNQGNQTRSFAYDALSRLTSQTTPEGGTVTFTYTSFDAVQTRTDARGAVTSYGYDALNRLQSVTYNTASAPGVATTSGVTINYKTTAPGKGQVSSVTEGLGSESYSYDSLARVSSKTRTIDTRSYQSQYQYNGANQLTLMIYPSGKRVRVNRDTRGRLSGLDKVDASNNVLLGYMSQVGYNTAGQVTGLNLGNGVVESYGYSNDRLQLTSQSATKGAATLMSLTYNYAASAGASGTSTTAGNSGQLMAITGTINSQNRGQSFTYDNVGRLLTATGWSAWQRRFAYDRWGNRTGMWNATTGGSQLQAITMQMSGSAPTNRIGNVNGVSYVYDSSGNVTNDGAYSYTYDAESRLVSVSVGGSGSYGYDSANRRIKKTASGVTTHYVWEGSEVIAEYDGTTGTLISEYVNAGGTMIREQGSAIRYYHSDRLSTRLITDGTGTVVGTQDHLPFGEDAGVVGESEKHRFTTYERDTESGSDYAVNRQHSFNTGRFLRPDPVLGSPEAPQSFNRYTYSSNDPINLSDPLGLTASGVPSAATSGRDCRIDGFDSPCWAAYALLGMDAAVIYNGDSLVWRNGRWERVGFDALGNQFFRPVQTPKLSFFQQLMRIVDRIVNAIIDVITKINQALGDILRFRYIAFRTGLSAHINSFKYDPTTRSFTVNFKDSVQEFLRNSPDFNGGSRLGGLFHGKDVGTTFPIDYRSITGQISQVSLQVVINPENLQRSYADFDRFNPYQDLRGFFGHAFLEVVPFVFRRLGGIFR